MAKIITITHDGVTRDLDMSTMKMRESLECQNLTGWTWTEWQEELQRDRAEAITYAWFLACKRHGDDVKYPDLFDVLDQARIAFGVRDDDDAPADTPAELGAEQGPTGPAETAGVTDPNSQS